MSHPDRPPHTPDRGTENIDEQPPFRSAEAWLAERGIERERIKVTVPANPGSGADSGRPGTPAGAGAAPQATVAGGEPALAPEPATTAMPAPSAREARQLATEQPPAVPGEGHDAPVAPGRDHPDLSDEVTRALSFIQRSTASVPASTGRLRRKLEARDVPAPAIRLALEQAADQGLVDDAAFAAALADEGRAKGHADTRIRKDLRTREFDDDVIAATLARHNDRDPEAVAFEVARSRAPSLRGVDSETAFRRLVGHLARRGHNEWVARKVAREVVFNELEDDVVSGH